MLQRMKCLYIKAVVLNKNKSKPNGLADRAERLWCTKSGLDK